jgi:hemolysin D
VNERAVTPATGPARRDPGEITGRDREFLPAALEILETPPAPLPVAMMLTICIFAFVALLWSFFGRLDVHAVAQGKIETTGYAKVVQPLESGKVVAIHVEDGARVKAGDLLLEMDPSEAFADERAASDALNVSLAEVARRKYAVKTVRAVQPDLASPFDPAHLEAKISILDQAAANADATIGWDETIPHSFRRREEAVLSADLTQLSDVLMNISKQMAQKDATRQRLNMSIAFQNNLIETLTQHVHTRQQAIDLNVGTKINLYDAKEQLQKSQSALASDQGQLIENDAALVELQSQKTKALSQFIAENENKAEEAARKADEARQNQKKASARLARSKLYASIDATVQQLAVTTVGQVVTTGQQLMVLVPYGKRLQVEALVPNIDIGFVKVGQDVAVKVDAFPFTRFGVLHGRVVKIAAEAVNEQEAKRAFANVAAAANNANMPSSNSPGQPDNFVFPVVVALDENTINAGGANIPLTSGMTVTVEIKTDQRRVIDYFLSPLAKVSSEALTER